MKIKVFERSGEIGKIGEFLNFEFIIDLKDFNLKKYSEEREKALKKYLEIKRRIITNVSQKIS